MALIKRISNLFTADAHAVLDLVEDPHNLLKQSIREMQQAIEVQQQTLRQLKSKRESLRDLIDRLDTERQQIDSDLDLCITQDNKTLARSLVRKKLNIKRQGEEIEEALAHTEKQLISGQSELESNRAKLECIQLEADVYASQKTQSTQQRVPAAQPVSEEDVEVALLKEIQARKQ